ncbi:hypothetical protein VE01_04073 [Pseudogymnoascus verrucosus]|uniref:Uncharacterized protein n=1 Tax=Pseudogymnoascus verrucosus TaxID=342668 RepID=A0A1B8GLK6_9PEZI|nr:uncharacterized protein VE01_04073 [Pseudogymnoascus verrucosus]OBT96719.1 hypothetical protein VE01_04073 [Pseudogymnoascus verrucosus]
MVGITKLIVVGLLGHVSAISNASSKLWYGNPAGNFQEALPVGNGRLGAVVFGTIAEKVVLNEDSVWSGGYQDRVNRNALGSFPNVVSNLNNGDVSSADSLWNSDLVGTPSISRIYQPVGNMILNFNHDASLVSNYNRTLDLKTASNVVSYQINGVKYTRQAIANYPRGVIGFRYTADRPKALSFTISLSRDQGVRSLDVNVSNRSITLNGKAPADSGLDFAAKIKIVTSTGTVTSTTTALTITNSQVVEIYFDAETAFRYPSEQQWWNAIDSKIDGAISAGWSSFYNESITDYQNLYNRVSLDLGNSGTVGTAETGTRLSNWRSQGGVNYDPELLTLAYNYGRFLLIGSSRPGSLPANLQGIWNDNFDPSWGSKFTININIQMNYWPAETTNLGETSMPVFDHLKRMQSRGQDVARTMYGAGGWVCHHNTDLWGDCAPHDSDTLWSANPMGGAWLSLQLIEHYRFSRDNNFAANVALPILSDALSFFYDFLILKPDGYYATGYAASPENQYYIPANKCTGGAIAGLDHGTAHDRQVLYELFKGFVELSDALGSTAGVSQAKDYLSKIKPPIVGNSGEILEWSGQYAEREPGHRHLSHLVAVYPGSQISPLLNTTLSNAALVSINRRMEAGSGNMGWSRAWAAGIYARLLQGNEAVSHVLYLVSSYLSNNLFDLNTSVFQIDGNLGLVAAFTEVLLQSHAGVVHLTPALANNVLAAGSVKGLVARGNFVVDITWANHALLTATVRSQIGGMLALRIAGGTTFSVDGVRYSGPISTIAGRSYSITV